MKRILLIVNDITKNGGTERAGINLANMLSKVYEVTLLDLCNINESNPYYEVNANVSRLYAKLGEIPNLLSMRVLWYYKCYKFLKSISENIEIMIGLTHNINIVLSFINGNNIKKIGCEHVSFSSIPNFSKFFITKRYSYLDVLVVLSDYAKTDISFLNKKVVVIPNKVSFKTSITSDLNQNRILLIGRLSKEKGYERLLSLSKFLKLNHPDWRIDILGDGEIYSQLVVMFQEYENISLLGSRKDVEKEYLSSSIYLSTSYHEAMPMVFIEAMTCGVPIVSFKHQGADCLLTDELKELIVYDEQELIVKVDKLISDIAYRKLIGNISKEKSFNYQEDIVIKKWVELFNSL